MLSLCNNSPFLIFLLPSNISCLGDHYMVISNCNFEVVEIQSFDYLKFGTSYSHSHWFFFFFFFFLLFLEIYTGVLLVRHGCTFLVMQWVCNELCLRAPQARVYTQVLEICGHLKDKISKVHLCCEWISWQKKEKKVILIFRIICATHFGWNKVKFLYIKGF